MSNQKGSSSSGFDANVKYPAGPLPSEVDDDCPRDVPTDHQDDHDHDHFVGHEPEEEVVAVDFNDQDDEDCGERERRQIDPELEVGSWESAVSVTSGAREEGDTEERREDLGERHPHPGRVRVRHPLEQDRPQRQQRSCNQKIP